MNLGSAKTRDGNDSRLKTALIQDDDSASMPRYFFNVLDREPYIDSEGSDVAEGELRDEVIRFAGGLLRDGISAALWEDKTWILEVRDEAGRRVIVLRLTGTAEAPREVGNV